MKVEQDGEILHCNVERETARVANIPLTVAADALLHYLEGRLGRDSVCAVEILSEYKNWNSRGRGRVQFSALEFQRHARSLSLQNSLVFMNQNLIVSESYDDIIRRPSLQLYRVDDGALFSGFLKGPGHVCYLERWDEVRGWVMREERRVEFWLCRKERECYKIDISFEDITEAIGYRLGGVPNVNCLLLKVKHGPKIYQRVSGPNIKSQFSPDRYHICKEDHDFLWIRTTDFSSIKSFGHSTCFCWKLDDGLLASDVFSCFPFYTEDLEKLILEDGSRLSCVSEFVPLVQLGPDVKLSDEVVFHLNSLVHAQKINFSAVDSELIQYLSNLSSDVVTLILQQLHKSKIMSFNPLSFVKIQVESLTLKGKINLPSHQTTLSVHTMRCRRVLITPTKVYCMGPEVETSNYVVKHFAAYSQQFLRVAFVDEDWTKLQPNVLSVRVQQGISAKPFRTKIYHRILSILRDGIILGSKKYEFLAFSASQLRSGACWMFASNDELNAQDIRNWMGCFNSIRSVSKCSARMGQLFSTSQQICDVPFQSMKVIPDIEVTTEGINYCFSDGIGKISLSFAKEVAEKCGLDKPPSLFQIRYGGYKGVVAVERYCFKKLLLRKSMLKFVSNNTMLNVTNWSKPMPCFLNREIVTLLTSLGVQDEVFENLLQEQLTLLNKMLFDRMEAIAALEKLTWADSSNILLKMLHHGYDPLNEPYLLMMLKGYRDSLITELRSRCRVFVPKGRILVGCLDETGNLNYGQCFVRLSTRSSDRAVNDPHVVTGKVVVTRNPCLHPGDIRVLEAVDDPTLSTKYLIDCIVFPQKGPRPHPNECSGGDLDGDQFFVCWDEKLIPTSTEKAMNYVGGRPRIMDHEITMEEIGHFFVDYMINDTLGAISTAHLVHSDREPDGARSEKCLQLAALHSVAVDFAKRGSPAEMPRYLKPKCFPDFMERTEKPMYKSKGILGKLYRATVSVQPLNPEMGCLPYDHNLEVKGFDKYLQVALTHRDLYNDRMTTLMNYFGAKSEDEILTGNLRERASYLQRDTRKYTDIKDRISAGLKNLQKEAVEWFTSTCCSSDQNLLACAWYHVVYHPNYRDQGANCLSFPWIMGGKLLSIKSRTSKD